MRATGSRVLSSPQGVPATRMALTVRLRGSAGGYGHEGARAVPGWSIRMVGKSPRLAERYRQDMISDLDERG